MTFYNLFLDDVRLPKNVTWIELPLVEWKIAKNFKEFVQIIQTNGLPERISFDHDLAYEDQGKTSNFKEKTGYDCAKWLIEYCMAKELYLPIYYVHSHNPIGAQNIISLIESYRRSQDID